MNNLKQYLDTHIHSHYSLLDGVSSPTANVKRAKELGATAVAITDHGFVSGVFEHYFACKEQGLKPMLGCEFYMRKTIDDDNRKYYHGIFIAMNEKGVENLLYLCSLGCSKSHWKERRPVLGFDEIFAHNEGLLFTTGCMIGINGAAQRHKTGVKKTGAPLYEAYSETIEEVNEHYVAFKKVFGGRMFVEIGPASVTHDWDGKNKCFLQRPAQIEDFGPLKYSTNCLQEIHNRRALLMAKVHNLPVIVASDAHMCHPKLKSVQDLLMVNAPDNYSGFHFYQTHAMISSDEMWAEFQKSHSYVTREVFEQAIENTYKVADLVSDFKLKFEAMVPKFPMPLLGEDPFGPAMAFATDAQDSGLNPQELVRQQFCRRYDNIYKQGMTSRQFMMALIHDGGRLSNKPEYLKRLQDELKVICDNGVTDYTDYFLILADIVRAADELNVGVGPARGSAGGCLLSYLLKITSIDPIEYNLSFVRFLNEGRLKAGHPPDIDMDFTNRDPIVDYIFQLYGEDRTALVGAYQTIRTKAALKDIMRSKLGGDLKNDHPIHKICRDIDNAPQYYPSELAFLDGFEDDDGHHHPGLLEANKTLRKFLDENKDVEFFLREILEKPRHMSKHAGGVVITPTPIDRVIPTQGWQHDKCTQVGFKMLEKIGGLKIDILGVNTLNFIWDTVKLVKERHGKIFDPWRLPIEKAVFDTLRRGETSTVFQFDTSVVRPFLANIDLQSIDDLILITSVARPGGLDSVIDGRTVADHFLARRNGKEPVVFTDPLLEPILKETFGLVIFQEQIQKIFEVIGGLTPVESDEARRAVGKKNLKVLLSIEKQLFEGAKMLHGWDEKKCQALWDSFIGAANYAFNKAHATAYGIIAYACAYLKYNYPIEWWCSVLSHVESDKVRQYLSEVEKYMSLPDVNTPATKWVIDDKKLLPPLTLINGVGDNAVKHVQEKVPFTSFKDFLDRTDKRKLNKIAIERLILAGCFSTLVGKDDPNELFKQYYDFRKEAKKCPATMDRTKLIKERSRLLSVASYDYVETFLDVIKGGVYTGTTEVDGKAMENNVLWRYENRQGFHFVDGAPVITNPDDFELLGSRYTKTVAFIGMWSADSKMFYYQSKKTGDKMGAYKLYLENNRKLVEVVIWPDSLKDVNKKDLVEGAVIVVFGTLAFSEFKKATELRFGWLKRLL